MIEGEFKSLLHRRLRAMFPGCIILINDSSYRQGIPDTLVLWEDQWAALEVKKSRNEKKRPNQDYYIDLMANMSFAAFIYPENEEDVLNALQYTFSTRRTTRLPKRK